MAFTSRVSDKAPKPKEPALERAGEVIIADPSHDDALLTFTVSGYDSTIKVNGRSEFIRRYLLTLNTDEATRDHIIETGKLDRRNIRPDGSLLLNEPIPGMIETVTDWLPVIQRDYQKQGLTVPADKIEKIILEDMDRHAHRKVEGKAL